MSARFSATWLVARGALGVCAIGATVGGLAAQASAALPDGRAYELASAGDKASNQVRVNGQTGFTPGGDGVILSSDGGFDGSHGVSASNLYVALRKPSGWSMKALEPPLPTDAIPPQPTLPADFSVDGSKYVFASRVGYTPDDGGGVDVYLSDGPTSTWVSTNGAPKLTADTATARGIDANAEHLLFSTPELLDPREADGSTGRIEGEGLYMRAGGTTTLVSVDNDGELLNRCGALPPASSLSTAGSNNPVSDAGEVVFFTTGATGSDPSCDPTTSDAGQLYARVDGERTVLVSPTTRAVPDPIGRKQPTWLGATPDGSRVFFTSAELLTDDATVPNTLYAFDLPTDGGTRGTLRALTPTELSGAGDAGVINVVGYSDDGSRFYFVATGQLTSDAPADGLPKIYLWDDGALRFVSSQSFSFSINIANNREQSVSPDGSKLVFLSADSIPGGYDSGGTPEAYLYDADSGDLSCVSCNPSGDAPTGPARFHALGSTGQASPLAYRLRTRNVSDDGVVAFESPDALVADDFNGRIDVYEYRASDRTLHLISSGRSATDSGLLGMSADGSSIAFATLDKLTWQDTDNGDRDVYVARVGGGIPEPASRAPCVDDGCQGTPTLPPALSTPATAVFSGPGDVDEEAGKETIPVFSVKAIKAAQQRTWARTGRVTLTIRASEAGKISAQVKARIGKRSVVAARASKTAAAGGEVKLTLRLSKAARARLKKAGKLPLTIRVTYSGTKEAQTTSLTLKRAAAKKRGQR